MGISSWLYTKSSTKQVLKIVHPGGHAELHHRPVLASEIILRNPRCCVAHPNVFQQPWAIVAPDITLMPGQKFYVVPINTIRKLQKLSLKYNPTSHVQEVETSLNLNESGEGKNFIFSLCLNNNRRDGSNEGACNCLLRKSKIKANNSEESSKERLSNNLNSSETKAVSKNRTNDANIKAGSYKSLVAQEHWQPDLEIISEE